uniref:RRM domain-containing protein n=1 Tax=Megaselia scalaris TaxID=36166 RepID=T1GFR6_MEGSC
MGGGGGRNDDFFIGRRLQEMQGPTFELPELKNDEIKFSGRNRLYIGNLTNDVNESELIELFKPYGEISETFLNNEKNFAFLKLDFHANAEKAKRELDGTQRKGRSLRNLTPFVSNELLYRAFEVFGPLEKATSIADDRGKHTGEGIIEFVKKSSAMSCLRLCSEKCYFLTSALRPKKRLTN